MSVLSITKLPMFGTFVLLVVATSTLFCGCSDSSSDTQKLDNNGGNLELDGSSNSDSALESAIKHAAKILRTDPETVRKDYKVRKVDSRSDQTIEYEFFSMKLVGDKDVELLESMNGGYPDYFALEVNRKTFELVQSYTADE